MFRLRIPVDFDIDEAASDAVAWGLDPASNASLILEFLAHHPGTGFTPKEIREETEIPIEAGAWIRGALPQESYIKPKQPTLLNHTDITNAFGTWCNPSETESWRNSNQS